MILLNKCRHFVYKFILFRLLLGSCFSSSLGFSKVGHCIRFANYLKCEKYMLSHFEGCSLQGVSFDSHITVSFQKSNNYISKEERNYSNCASRGIIVLVAFLKWDGDIYSWKMRPTECAAFEMRPYNKTATKQWNHWKAKTLLKVTFFVQQVSQTLIKLICIT